MMVSCEPKHVGAAFIILTTLIIYGFYHLFAFEPTCWCELPNIKIFINADYS